ncbi:hypothetical protein [Bdellovibrio sp. GT3]|uniref:hypothetical protein n=1 Tax=Bdellovibrio sp. GT3 TaxID=3136282 RepID=UPI0030F3D965
MSVWIYYSDHGFPHVEIYQGKPENFEAHLKLNILNFEPLEVNGFSERSVRLIIKKLQPYREALLKDWYEIVKE